MDRQQRFWTGIALAAALASAAPTFGEECGIRSLGGSTRFADPIDSIVGLQSMFTRHWSEISRLLAEAGWAGDPDDLRTTVARGRVDSERFEPGTRIEWMMMRSKGVPHLVRDDCWGGSKPFEAYAFEVESKGRRWYFSVPKICGNLALMSSEPLAEARGTQAAPPAEPTTARVASAAAETTELRVVPSPPFNAEIFAGYFVPEELDDDLTLGARFGYRGAWDWGWLIAFSWFDVAESGSFPGNRTADANVFHVDFSAVFYPIDDGTFSIFFGPGWATGDVDVSRTTQDFSDDAFTIHAGMGYEFDVTRYFYIKPDLRLRYYELEGFGPSGGVENQLTYEIAVALGWRFGD
jgi:hypothetical protein